MISKRLLLTKETKGIFTNIINGYKLVEKDNLKTYELVTIPENSNFKIITFNVHTNRVQLFVHYNNKSEVLEVDYKNIIDYCIIDNNEVNSNLDAVLISDRVKYKISKENIKQIITYIIISAVFFLLGKI